MCFLPRLGKRCFLYKVTTQIANSVPVHAGITAVMLPCSESLLISTHGNNRVGAFVRSQHSPTETPWEKMDCKNVRLHDLENCDHTVGRKSQ